MALRWLEGWDGVSASDGDASQTDTQEYMNYMYGHVSWSGGLNPQVNVGRLDGQGFVFGVDGFSDWSTKSPTQFPDKLGRLVPDSCCGPDYSDIEET